MAEDWKTQTTMTRHMRAAVLEQLNAPLVLDDLGIPDLACGQVLVRVHRSGICGAQLGEIAGLKGEDRYLPHLLGHEGGGVVEAVGDGVTTVKPSDHVVMHWRKGVGINSGTPTYRRGDGRAVTAGWITTFNECAVVSENRVTPIPKDIPLDVAALMGCAVTTALGLINNDAQVKIGQSVAVFGCGGVGLNVVQAAAMVSANPIIAIDIVEPKLAMAHAFGATHTINSSAADVREEVRKIVGKQGVDVFIDTTGLPGLVDEAYQLTAANGRTILAGTARHDQQIAVRALPIQQGKVLAGTEGGQCNPTVDIPRYLNLYTRGRLKLDDLITHRFPLGEVNTALDKIRAGEVGRCVLVMDPS